MTKNLLRVLSGFILIVANLLVIPTSSNAFFGLSGCEKAWKNIKSEEAKIVYLLNRYPQGSELTAPSGSSLETKVKITFQAINEVWKVGTNNPKCFSNTQKKAIRNMGGEDFKNSVLDYNHTTYTWGLTKTLSTTYTVKTYTPLAMR